MTKVNREFSAKVKMEMRRRTSGRCQRCCRNQGTQFHHRRLRSQGGLGDIENCALLCEPCHTHVHANPSESYEEGWLVRSGLVDAG